MAGTNPYIQTSRAALPQKKYQITYVLEGKGDVATEKHTFEVDPADLPTSGTGLLGSVLDIALANDIDIDHACGGVCGCATCHVIVNDGYDTCSSSIDEEEDQLEKAPGLTPRSRLSCQCVPDGSKDIVVTIPAWNRNLVRE